MEWRDVVTAINAICSVVLGYLAFTRNRRTDTEQEARQDATVLTEIGYIKSGVDDIKTEQREQRAKHEELLTRLVAVESSAKQAHHRIDRLEGLTDHRTD